MLYSLNFIRKYPTRHERRMFYAENDTVAMAYMRACADATGLAEDEVWLEKHPHGFIFQREKLGPLFWPPEEREEGGGTSRCGNRG